MDRLRELPEGVERPEAAFLRPGGGGAGPGGRPVGARAKRALPVAHADDYIFTGGGWRLLLRREGDDALSGAVAGT